jgi:hypothetical protein
MKKSLKEFELKFKSSIATLIISAFGFVAALSWNDAIKSAIDTLLPHEKTVLYKFVSAVAITAFVVAATFLISRLLKEK